MQASTLLSHPSNSPSFNAYSSSSVDLADIAARVIDELRSQDPDGWPHLDEFLGENDTVGDGSCHGNDNGDGNGDCGDEDFEFAFVSSGEAEMDAPLVTADEIFCNGQIRPFYPYAFLGSGSNGGDGSKTVADAAAAARYHSPLRRNSFSESDLLSHGGGAAVDENGGHTNADDNSVPKSPPLRHHRPKLRMLMREERQPAAAEESSSSSEAADDDLSSIPPETYCVWTPKRGGGIIENDDRNHDRNKIKSSSTGGSSKRWRLRDLLYVRSSSDGKQFVFLAPVSKKSERQEKSAVNRGGDSEFARNSNGSITVAAAAEGQKRREYLPYYRKDMIGIFANVNGLSRNLHPF